MKSGQGLTLPQELAATTFALNYLAFRQFRCRQRAERLANGASPPVENPGNAFPPRSTPHLSLAFSLRLSSRSTASRMKAAMGSPAASTASIRARVPFGSRAGICSSGSLICFLPTPDFIEDITFIVKAASIVDINY